MKKININKKDSKVEIIEGNKLVTELTYNEILQMYADMYNIKSMNKEAFAQSVKTKLEKFSSCSIQTNLPDDNEIRKVKGEEIYNCSIGKEFIEYTDFDIMINELYNKLTIFSLILGVY